MEETEKICIRIATIGRCICCTVWESNPANCDAAHVLFGAIELINKSTARLFIRWYIRQSVNLTTRLHIHCRIRTSHLSLFCVFKTRCFLKQKKNRYISYGVTGYICGITSKRKKQSLSYYSATRPR